MNPSEVNLILANLEEAAVHCKCEVKLAALLGRKPLKKIEPAYIVNKSTMKDLNFTMETTEFVDFNNGVYPCKYYITRTTLARREQDQKLFRDVNDELPFTTYLKLKKIARETYRSIVSKDKSIKVTTDEAVNILSKLKNLPEDERKSAWRMIDEYRCKDLRRQ